MVKRGSESKAAVANARPAKSAKVKVHAERAKTAKEEVAAVPTVVDPFAEKCEAVIQAIEDMDHLLVGSKTVLAAAAPFCFRSDPAARHTYETNMIELIEKCLREEEMKRQEAVATVESTIARDSAEVEQARTEMDGQQALVNGFKENKDAKEASFAEAEQALKHGNEVLQEAKANVHALTEERKKQEEEKEEFTKVAETFASLRSGTVGEGEEATKLSFKEKRSLIANMTKQLPRAGVPKSLLLALDIALKAAPDQRGHFSSAAVEHCDKALNEFLQSLDTKLGSFEGELSNRSIVVQEAEGKVEAFAADKAAALEAVNAADNLWVDEQEKLRTMQAKIDGFEDRTKKLNSELDKVQDRVLVFQTCLTTFGVLKEYGTQEPPKPPSPEPEPSGTVEADAESPEKAEVVSMEPDPVAATEAAPDAVMAEEIEAVAESQAEPDVVM